MKIFLFPDSSSGIKYKLMLILVCFCYIAPLCAQDHLPQYYKPGDVLFDDPFEHLELQSGVGWVYFQDSKGFLWVHQGQELKRYDGYQFRSFRKVPSGPDDLNAYFVEVVTEDSRGNIWIGTHRKEGLYRYDPRTEIFLRFPREGIDPPLIADAETWSIAVDSKGKVWIGTTQYQTDTFGIGRGLYCYDYATDSFTVFMHDPNDPRSIPTNNIMEIRIDSEDNIWLTSLWSTFHLDPETGKFTSLALLKDGGDTIPVCGSAIMEDKEGNLWFHNDTRTWPENKIKFLAKVTNWRESIDPSSGDSIYFFREYETYPAWFGKPVLFDQQDHLWLMHTGYGLIRFEPGSEDRQVYLPEDYQFGMKAPPGMFDKLISDASGNLYLGIWNVGTQRIAAAKQKFSFYGHRFFGPETEDVFYSKAACSDSQDNLWLGIQGFLVKYNKAANELKFFTPVSKEHAREDWILGIITDENGLVYLAAKGALHIFDPVSETFESIPFPGTKTNLSGIVEGGKLIMDRSGKIWMGGESGCILLDPVELTAKHLYQDEETENFTGGMTYSLQEDSLGRIWLGTGFGLNRYDPESGESIKLRNDPKNPRGLLSHNLFDLELDQEGNLWIGYLGYGVSKLDARYVYSDEIPPDEWVFEHFTKKEGLSNLEVWGLQFDQQGDLWIFGKELFRLNPESGEITSFDEGDGVLTGNLTGTAALLGSSGEIFIGGKNGMISFIPDCLPENKHYPPVVITRLDLHDEPVAISDTTPLNQSITYTDHLDLSYEENFIAFEFAALDFTAPEKNQYKYFMEGLDTDTVYSGTKRTAEYRNMKPGKYTFWVTGSNNDGIWNPDGITLDIRIHPPWYRSGVAQSGYVAFMILLVLGYVRLRTERLKKDKLALEAQVAERTSEIRQKNKQILEMEGMKTRFFTNVSHEIRTPLSLITGPLESLMKKDQEDETSYKWLSMIKRNSQRLLQLVNQLLDISKLDAGKMKLVIEEADILAHLRMLSNEYLSLAESKGVSYVIDVPEGTLISKYDREKVDKVITNLLSNAFKFTPSPGTVTCRVRVIQVRSDSTEPLKVRIIVADTGPGIPLKEREKIFERFYRAEGELYDDAGGTGIGLNLTRELVSLMHGEIVLKSAEGSGALFFVTIPLGIEHLDEGDYILKELEIGQSSDEAVLTGKEEVGEVSVQVEEASQVLIVEDNEDLRTFIGENLTHHYKVTVAADGLEGLSKATSEIPDLIISDVMMPGMNGMELCEKLKGDERTSHIPVIMLTAKSTHEDKMEGLELGADDYLFKPFNIEELTVRIRNLLEQREGLRKKYANMIGMDWGKMSVTTLDEEFLKKVTAKVTEHMQDFEFDVATLQDQMAMSRGHLFKKLKALTGESPSSLIRVMRLKAAASMIEKGGENITEISMNVGFTNPSYFAQCFKEQFGKSPSEYKSDLSL